MNNKYALVIVLVVIIFVFHSASADTIIPSWIKTNAKYWKDGQIGDDEYVKGMQFLIKTGVMQIPPLDKVVEKSSKIPSWIKNTAGYWADGSLGDFEYVASMQYLIGEGMIDLTKQSLLITSTYPTAENDSSIPTSNTENFSNIDASKCNSEATPADKQTCLDGMQSKIDIKAKIANATPLVVGPVTYYVVNADLVNTGDGGVFINVHTVLENTGSPSSNPDLFCTGPYACNYHLSDGQVDYPPSIFSLTSGHLELTYHKPVTIDWNFYSKENIGGFTYSSSNTYSFKVSESFGSGSIPLKLVTQ